MVMAKLTEIQTWRADWFRIVVWRTMMAMMVMVVVIVQMTVTVVTVVMIMMTVVSTIRWAIANIVVIIYHSASFYSVVCLNWFDLIIKKNSSGEMKRFQVTLIFILSRLYLCCKFQPSLSFQLCFEINDDEFE